MKEGWKIKKLGEITSFVGDGDWIESKDQSSGGIRLIQTGNIGGGIYKDKGESAKYISPDTFHRLHCTEIFAGDCLVSRLPDPIGRACILPKLNERTITAVDCSIIRFKPTFLPQLFVYYSLSNRYQSYINTNATGTTRKRISRKRLEQAPVPIPSVAEQNKIVAELDCLTGIIEKKKKQLEELDKLAQSIFYDMFGNPIANEKGWRTRAIQEVAPQTSYKGNIPSHNGKYWLLNLDMVEAQTGAILDEVLFDEKEIGGSTTTFNEEMVLYSKLRPYLNKVVLPMKPGYGTSELVPLLPDKSIINRYFLAYLLRSPSFVAYISLKVAGAKMPRVSLDVFRRFPVILPPLALQNEFAHKIEAIEHQKELIKKSKQETETLFNSRMDYWFN